MLQLIRWKNLLFLGVLQTLMFFGIIKPLMAKYAITLPYEYPIFGLLLAATLFIAAGGYIVNDYFDTKIDQINKPTEVIVGNKISRNAAGWAFQICFALGIACGIALGILLSKLNIAILFAVISGMLWFYSSSYKRIFLLGNLVISLCSFLSVFSIGYLSAISLENKYGALIYNTSILNEVYGWCAAFGLFAFLYTFIREVVKDVEDIEGDREMECHSLPIVLGINTTKIVLTVITLISTLIVGYFCFYLNPFTTDNITTKYYIFGVLVPSFILIFWIGKAAKRRDWMQISTFVKFIMLVGTLYAAVVGYLFVLNYSYILNA
jgi:4-hydroxybenzoate polyprenyltransferase